MIACHSRKTNAHAADDAAHHGQLKALIAGRIGADVTRP
jgi:hypothetical protein